MRPIQALFARVGLELTAIERVATKGGSLRYFVQRPQGPVQPDGSVQQLLEEEDRKGIYRKDTYDAYAARIDALKRQTLDFLRQAKAEPCLSPATNDGSQAGRMRCRYSSRPRRPSTLPARSRIGGV